MLIITLKFPVYEVLVYNAYSSQLKVKLNVNIKLPCTWHCWLCLTYFNFKTVNKTQNLVHLHEGCPNETHLVIVQGGLEAFRNNHHNPRMGDLLKDPPVQELLGFMVSCTQIHDQLWHAIFGSSTMVGFPPNPHTYKKIPFSKYDS